MLQSTKQLLLTSIILISLDFVYLSLVSNHFDDLLKGIQGSKLSMKYHAGFFAYVFLVFGLYYFIIREERSIIDAMLLGWVIYAVYEFTNMAIIDSWTWKTVAIDGIWGGIVFGLTTYLVNLVSKYV